MRTLSLRNLGLSMKHANNGRVNYLLEISTDDENEEFFSELGQRIAKLACENNAKFLRLKSLKPADLELIKNMYPRIYTSKTTGKVSCKLSERKKDKGVFKRREMKIDDLVDE